MTKTEHKITTKVFTTLGVVLTGVLLIAGCLSFAAYRFATGTVHDQLAGQQIYFPQKGSAALDPEEFPGLQRYAGQRVDDGPKAKAFADEYIAVHLKKVAAGKTYSQVSAASIADPGNTALKQEAQTLFQGETLRGMLLGDGYAYWTMGHIAGIASLAFFAGAIIVAALSVLGMRRMVRMK